MLGQTNCPYYYTQVSIEQGSTAFYTLQQSFIVFINSAFGGRMFSFKALTVLPCYGLGTLKPWKKYTMWSHLLR